MESATGLAARIPQSPFPGATAAALLAALIAGCAIAGCTIADGTGAPSEVVLEGPTMGTHWRVRALAAPRDREAIRGLVEERLDAVDAAMSTYRNDSELSRFNRLAAGERQDFSEETWGVLELGWQVREQSGGAFDPTVGRLVDAWGFGAAGRDAEPIPPDQGRLARLRQAVGAIELSAADRRARKLDDDAAIDLSAIAKGWAVDRVSEALAAAGHGDHMVEIGGEVRTAGRSRSGGPWRIAIERPPQKSPGTGATAAGAVPGRASTVTLPPGLQRVLELGNDALATSGDYRNYWQRGGKRYSHTIDPRTGRPVDHALASASVIHERCAVADAYATALMVLGPDDGLHWANEHGIAALLLVYRGDALVERSSDAFRRRFGDGSP